MSREAPFLGTGWSFPPSFTQGGADVRTVAGTADIEESLGILLSTRPGERIMRETFGCDLDRLLFEENDQRAYSQISRLVSDAILYHEPRIDLENVEVEAGSEDPAQLSIRVEYSVRGTNSRANWVYPFYLREASVPGTAP